jgi:hypothetical protein
MLARLPDLRGFLLLAASVLAVLLVAPQSAWYALSGVPEEVAGSDFQLHWAAARALELGLDPYEPEVVERIGAPTGRGFTPFCAANPLMLRLFLLAGAEEAADLVRGYRAALRANALLLALSVVLLMRALQRAGRARGFDGPEALAVALAVLLLNDGTWSALYYNQLNFVALAAIVGALCAGQRGASRTEGVLLALAAIAKTSPALLIVVAALAGRWRTVRAAAVTGALLLAVSVAWNGWAVHESWARMAGRELGYAAELREGRFSNSLHDWNLAPNGALSRAAHAAGWADDVARVGAWAISAMVLTALVVAVRRARRGARSPAGGAGSTAAGSAQQSPVGAGRRSGGQPTAVARAVFADYALGVAASFLVSSVTWIPHLSLAAVPAAWLILQAWTAVPRPPTALLLAGAAACVVQCLPLGTFDASNDQSLDIRLKLAACFVLFSVIVALTREGEGESEGETGTADGTAVDAGAGTAA